MGNEKLSREAWVAAGFRALAEKGPAALQINLLAGELGATKGSFYWHFKDLRTYKSAMLDLWKEKVANEIIDDVSRQTTPQARLEALFASAVCAAPDAFGGRKIEPAMRAWALSDADVATALAELDARRKEFIGQLLADLGIKEPALTDLAYGAYIGLDDLHAKGRANIERSMEVLQQMILDKAEQTSKPI